MADDEVTRLPEGYGGEYSLRPGQIFGQFRIVRPLGRGGMGEVYEVEHAKLGTRHAIKLINEEIVERASVGQRFEREAKVMANLRHPNIVHVDDYGETDGRSWLRMELVAGAASNKSGESGVESGEFSSLSDLLTGERLSEALVVDLLKQILGGLSCAHEQGLVHRDLKPSNILLQANNLKPNTYTPKITDFGLVRLAGEQWLQSQVQLTVARSAVSDPDATRLEGGSGSSAGTSTQAMLGTFEFMAPEQKKGQEADARSDLYAVGLMAFRMLTGHDTPGLRRPSEIVPGLNPAWDDFVLQALEMDPAERFENAEAMAQALPSGEAAMADGGSGRTDVKKTRKGLWLVLVAVLVLAGVLGAGYFLTTASTELSLGKGTETRSEAAAGLTAELTEEQGSTAALAEGLSDSSDLSDPEALSTSHSPLFTLTVEPSAAAARVWLVDRTNVPVEGGELGLEGLPSGEHELIVQAAGYEPFSTRVSVGEGGAGEQLVRLVPVKGRLRVLADAGTSVTAVSASGREIALGRTDASGELLVDRLLTVGEYDLRLEKAKHATKVLESVELILGREVKAEWDLAPLPGKLNVFTVPQGATISLNGNDVGTSSTTLDGLPTEVPLVVEVHKPGYRREKEELTLDAAGSRSLNFGTLVAEAGDIKLRIENGELSNPEKLEWSIDGEKQYSSFRSQVSSLFAEGLELGARELRVSHPDYEAWSGTAEVRDQETTKVSVSLKPKLGTLELAVSPAGVSYSLTVDGKAADLLSGDRYRVPSEAKLELVVSAKGYKSVLLEGTVPANGTARVPVTLEKQLVLERGRDWTVDLGRVEGVELKWIAPGSFQMGSPYSSEKYRVSLSSGYWLGATEVTQGQWQSVMGSNPSSFKGSNLPVEQVSWEDAMEFCRKLTERERAAGRLAEGLSYTLPTESQWEYACRAGTSGEYAGDLDAMGWYDKNSGRRQTHPVGIKRANGWGLYDMHGNVWEWCSDWYGSYPSGSVTDPTGANTGSSRVCRGGCWGDSARRCRSASRSSGLPGGRSRYLGFRLALSSVR